MTVKDDKKIKHMDTMTASKTSAIDIKTGDALTLHAELVSVIVADAAEAIVQYGNGAQRLLKLHALADYLELGTFPSSTRFSRPGSGGIEVAYVEHVTADGYIMDMIDAKGEESSQPVAMTYSELMAWHMAGEKNPPELPLPSGATLYVPKKALSPTELNAKMDADDAEVDKLAAVLEALDAEQPFEADLNRRIAQLEADLAAAEIEGQQRINALTQENHRLKEDIRNQALIHNTVVAGYEEDIRRLEAKAAILAPSCKEFDIKRDVSASELGQYSRDGWQIQHTQFENSKLYVLFTRDLPASPAPKVAVTDAAIYGTPVPHLPVTQPPMPAGQTVIMRNGQPVVSRALTHNVPKPGATKRISTVASIQARREQDEAEINAIFQRGRERAAQIIFQPSRPFGT